MTTIDITKKYTTRGGLEVHLLSDNAKRSNMPIVGEIKHPNGSWQLNRWCTDGRMSNNDNISTFDLVEVKTKKYGYIFKRKSSSEPDRPYSRSKLFDTIQEREEDKKQNGKAWSCIADYEVEI